MVFSQCQLLGLNRLTCFNTGSLVGGMSLEVYRPFHKQGLVRGNQTVEVSLEFYSLVPFPVYFLFLLILLLPCLTSIMDCTP